MRITHQVLAWPVCSLGIFAAAFAPPARATAVTVEATPAWVELHKNGGPNASAYAPPGDDAGARAAIDTAELRRRIGAKSAEVSPQTRANAERRLVLAAQRVDLMAQDAGDAMLAGRLSREFRLSPGALARERAESDGSWGGLVIAHTLAANTRVRVEPTLLMRWRNGGIEWSQLASGLGLSLNSVVRSVDTEARVAAGLTGADGRVAAIYGEGARGGGPGLDTGAGAR